MWGARKTTRLAKLQGQRKRSLVKNMELLEPRGPPVTRDACGAWDYLRELKLIYSGARGVQRQNTDTIETFGDSNSPV